MEYSPAQSGLVDTYVTIIDLLAHANYTFEVEAVNGVSDLSRTQRLFAAVSIATGQAGKISYFRLFELADISWDIRRNMKVWEAPRCSEVTVLTLQHQDLSFVLNTQT